MAEERRKGLTRHAPYTSPRYDKRDAGEKRTDWSAQLQRGLVGNAHLCQKMGMVVLSGAKTWLHGSIYS